MTFFASASLKATSPTPHIDPPFLQFKTKQQKTVLQKRDHPIGNRFALSCWILDVRQVYHDPNEMTFATGQWQSQFPSPSPFYF